MDRGRIFKGLKRWFSFEATIRLINRPEIGLVAALTIARRQDRIKRSSHGFFIGSVKDGTQSRL